jgi:hypothetical protein
MSDLIRWATQSPDHFTCTCGQWCLRSECPYCEKSEDTLLDEIAALKEREDTARIKHDLRTAYDLVAQRERLETIYSDRFETEPS